MNFYPRVNPGFPYLICKKYINRGLLLYDIIWAVSSGNAPPSMLKICGYTSSCTCAKYHPRIFSPLKHSVVANDPVCGQRRSWLDCADAQANLVLRCPHIHEDIISHSATYIKYHQIANMLTLGSCEIFLFAYFHKHGSNRIKNHTP